MKIELESGRYTYIFDEKTGQQKVLRYGEEWRDLVGDNFILAMAQEIERLKEDNAGLIAACDSLQEYQWMYQDLQR